MIFKCGNSNDHVRSSKSSLDLVLYLLHTFFNPSENLSTNSSILDQRALKTETLEPTVYIFHYQHHYQQVNKTTDKTLLTNQKAACWDVEHRPIAAEIKACFSPPPKAWSHSSIPREGGHIANKRRENRKWYKNRDGTTRVGATLGGVLGKAGGGGGGQQLNFYHGYTSVVLFTIIYVETWGKERMGS